MRCFLKPTVWCRTAWALLAVCILLLAAGPAAAADEAMLKRMEELIQKQQEQIEAQNRAIENLQKQVNNMTDTAVEEAREAAAEAATEAAKTEVAKTTSDVVRNAQGDKVNLKLYGHANRAYLWADDGDSSDSYFVDNDNSSSRVGAIATAQVTDDISFGGQFELEYQSNPSNVVSQDNKNPGDSGDGTGFDERVVEATVTSKRFGKLYLGKGYTASDGTSEVDLSGTSVVMYSSVADSAGGIKFYDDDSDTLPGTKVGHVFDNFDGLSRRNRLRYDSPTFWGFSLQGSVLSDGGDVALKYAAKWGENWKFAAAASYANPQAQSVGDTIDSQVSGSASILHSTGLNLTLAGGYGDLKHDAVTKITDGADADDEGRSDDPFFGYVKLGYRAKFFDFGATRFSADYGRYENRSQDNDEADTVAVGVVQDLSKWGMEYYLAWRYYDLDRDEGTTDFDEINTIFSGVRVKF